MSLSVSIRRGLVLVLLVLLIIVTALYLTSNSSTSVPEMVTRFMQRDTSSSQLVPGLTFRLYTDVVITEQSSPAQAEAAFYYYIDTRHLDCTEALHVGDQAAIWPVCVASLYRPRPPCLVYSFGTSDNYKAEKDAVNRLGCEVRVFDPRIAVSQESPTEHISAYNIAVGNNNIDDHEVTYRTVAALMTEHKDTETVIDYLKLDIDSNEWGVLEGMIEDKSLSHVKQLAITIHTAELAGQTTSVHQFKNYWHLIHSVENLGFRKWYASAITDGRYSSKHTGTTRACCYQLVYVNTNFSDRHYSLPELSSTAAIFVPPPTQVEGITLTSPNTVTLHAGMSPTEAENAYYQFVTKDTATCATHKRVGNIRDGGWDMCTAGIYKPQAKEQCLVYSFGINNDWSFDDAISKQFGCTVRAFDPSMKVGDHKHSDKVWFYHTGISDKNYVNGNGWKLRTLGTLIQELGDSDKVIDYLKIDVEYSEWGAFIAMFNEKSLLKVKQFGFEVHTHELHRGSPSTVEQFVSYYEALKKLEDIGFRKWLHHLNPFGQYISKRTGMKRGCCHELYYINTRFFPQT